MSLWSIVGIVSVVWLHFCCKLLHILQNHPFRLKINNHYGKKIGSCINIIKNCKNFTFKVNFFMSKMVQISLIFFLIEQYNFFVIEIFWHLQFLKHFIFLNDVQFLKTAMHVCKRPKIFFIIVFIGFQHKGWSCKVCESVRQKCG